jgi:predicted nucleic acid-binding protein
VPEPTAVVFDVNVLVNAIVGKDSSYPLLASLPPTTSNAAADSLSLIFDAEEFALFVSPHILRNTVRVLVQKAGVSSEAASAYINAVTEMVKWSGGSIVEPPRTVHEVRDFEDNLILDLVAEVGALILVTDDTDLTEMNPWNGRLLLRPRQFVERAVQARRTRNVRPPQVANTAGSGQPRNPAGAPNGGEFGFKQQSPPEVTL